MDIYDMRAAIVSVYPNATWKHRVSRMGDDQIVAIYYKFLKDGKFDKKPKKDTVKGQLSVFDFV